MKNKSLHLTGCLIATLGLFNPSVKATTYFDDFNDGDDTGWARYQPMNVDFGGTAYNTFTFPGGGYKITSIAGVATDPGRVGSLFSALTVSSTFEVGADLLDWSSSIQQYMGVLSRYAPPAGGPFAPLPTGYALVLNTAGTGLVLNRLNASSAPTTITSAGEGSAMAGGTLAANPAGDYRLKFWGVGADLYGQIIDLGTGIPMTFNDGTGNLTDTVTGTDATYASGQTGLFGTIRVMNSDPTALNVDPTFDNFVAADAVPEPTAATLAGLGLAALLIFRRRK